MKRVIKFRAKTKNTNRWFFGNLVSKDDVPYIFAKSIEQFYEVIPRTIGQFTGKLDINGIEMYEGDIVNFTRSIGDWLSGIGYRQLTTKHTIVWDNDVSRFGLTINSSDTMKFREHPKYIYEVVGNIFDTEQNK